MTRFALAMAIAALLASPGIAQEPRSDQPPPNRPAARQPETRQEYRNTQPIEVKDPAEFAKLQEEKLFSGPQPGEEVPDFEVLGVRGELEGKKYTHGEPLIGQTQVLIFQDNNGSGLRGLLGFARQIDKLAKKSKNGPQLTAILLGDDSGEIMTLAKRVDGYFPASVHLGVSPEGRDGPGALGLNRNVSMTILLTKDDKVTHSFALPQGMLYPDPHVLGAVAELMGEKRETVAAWLNEDTGAERPVRQGEAGQAMRGNLTPQRQAFQARLAELIQAGKLTRIEAGELIRLAFPEPDPGK